MFVEFSENSVAAEFVKNDSIRYKETELIRFMKKEYFEKKAIERQETKKNIQLEKSQKLRDKLQNDIPFISGRVETVLLTQAFYVRNSDLFNFHRFFLPFSAVKKW